MSQIVSRVRCLGSSTTHLSRKLGTQFRKTYFLYDIEKTKQLSQKKAPQPKKVSIEELGVWQLDRPVESR